MLSDADRGALASGRGFVDLSHWRKAGVTGVDALVWLSAVGTATVEDLSPGRAQATEVAGEGDDSLAVTVALVGAEVLVLQDPAQPTPIAEALKELAGSHAVTVHDRCEALAVFAFPGAATAPDVAGTAFAAPSCLGAGVDIFALAEDHDYLLRSLQHGFTLVTLDAARAWLEQAQPG